MATYSELYDRCRRRLGRKNFDMASDFLDEMKAAQEILERGPALPRWMKYTAGPFITPSGGTTVTSLPPLDYIRAYDDLALGYVDAEGNLKRAVRLDTFDQLIQKRNEGVVGDTLYWFETSKTEGSGFELAPTLTRDTTFYLTYYAKQTVLTGANENLWVQNEPDLIMGMAGEQLATWLRDDRALQYFVNLHQTARARMIRTIEADEWVSTDLVMGDPD